jgi:hypothetical protein
MAYRELANGKETVLYTLDEFRASHLFNKDLTLGFLQVDPADNDNILVRAPISFPKNPHDFPLSVRKSAIPNAGSGLFASRSVPFYQSDPYYKIIHQSGSLAFPHTLNAFEYWICDRPNVLGSVPKYCEHVVRKIWSTVDPKTELFWFINSYQNSHRTGSTTFRGTSDLGNVNTLCAVDGYAISDRTDYYSGEEMIGSYRLVSFA